MHSPGQPLHPRPFRRGFYHEWSRHCALRGLRVAGNFAILGSIHVPAHDPHPGETSSWGADPLIRRASHGACATAASPASAAEAQRGRKHRRRFARPTAALFIAYNTVLAADRMIRTPRRDPQFAYSSNRAEGSRSSWGADPLIRRADHGACATAASPAPRAEAERGARRPTLRVIHSLRLHRVQHGSRGGSRGAGSAPLGGIHSSRTARTARRDHVRRGERIL